MSFIRIFGHLTTTKDVVGVAVRISAEASAAVTDIQLVPGSSLFSWSPQVGDLHLKSDLRWRYINGMVMSEYDTWVMSDEDIASPYNGVFYPHGAQELRWGMLEFGEVSTKQEFDGTKYTISSGAGVTPHLTARADQRIDIKTDGIMSAIVGIKGIHSDPGSPDRTDLGTVIASHYQGWPAVLGWHEDWDDVLAEHGAWS